MAVLNSLGSGLAGLGTLLTAPFGLVLLTNAYLSSTRENTAPTRAAEPE
jgi:multisubunit Na+/H+ antiporter MnhG subunit